MKKIIFVLGGLIIFLNINNLFSKNYLYRRIRNIKSQEEIAVNYFVQQLRDKLDNKILGAYLIPIFLREAEERLDIIIIYKDIEENKLLNVASKISYEIAVKYGETVIPIALSTKEFRQNLNLTSPTILWQIFQDGSCLHLNSQGKKLLTEVSKKFINSAEEKLNKGEFKSSFFALYHAALTLLNTAVSGEGRYSLESGDIFEQFRKNFILTDKVPADWGKKINRLRELNKKLSQNPNIAIDKKELTSVMDFVRNLYLYLKD